MVDFYLCEAGLLETLPCDLIRWEKRQGRTVSKPEVDGMILVICPLAVYPQPTVRDENMLG